MAKTAGDILVQTLIDWGVDTIFGIPGDGINGVMEALRVRKDEIKFVQVRHEEAAAFAACAYAKFTGRLGVCLSTSGPGGIHLLNGIYDAKLDSQPVLAITGLQHHDLLDTLTQQDVDLDKLFMDSCAYSVRVMGAAHMQNVAEMACRIAMGYRQPTHITIPVDVQSQAVSKDDRSERNIKDHVSNVMARGGHLPDPAQLERAAEILSGAKKPFILAGRGALGARAELEAMAARLKAPVGMALLGKGAIPDESPYATGGVGLLGTRASQEAMEECDTLLIVGSCFPYVEFYPKPGSAHAVQIDLDPKRIGLRYPVEAGLVGDSGKTLEALLPLVQPNPSDAHLKAAQETMREWRELMHERGTRRDTPMKPQVVTHELNKLLKDDAIVITDSGTITSWTARHVDMRGDMMFSCSGTLASMACGLPYAIGAATAYPRRQVVAVIGDGAMAMLMGDLVTLRKYNLDVKLIVIKNNSLGQIKWEQMVFLGNPEYACELEPIDFVRVAEGCGIRGVSIEDPERCGEQLREALATPGPCLIECVVDPNEPPMPPKTTAKQALHLAESLARGTPGAGKIALTIASDVVRELV
ncbi:MAG TPA: thiamine pyrophosphate-dependent enzyme [Allosphingosinicella sp.]|jgi:pyruvate dehydrogenase (quinone)/pyruvate oxidase|nr:thiamine pyrophosphate-dependent enzyme [Allosphingosinicella sp.]